ncbi:hypothetical protein GEV33_011935 [Tenebrio molitor]|uniref:Receptor ligand binding region domain-containing protein n=1 Tax=Tenebrio molitor TaxID=7067 RepID=A0A8J6HA90_TENMO|nr:hypothetical protein GEV33_011935 [Tenebrio molitor]
MKIVYQNVIWIVLFAAYNYISLAQDPPIEFDIAAFFHEENSQTRVAFETAISKMSIMQKTFSFNARSHVIPEGDTFASNNMLCNLMASGNGLSGVICPGGPKVAAIMESTCRNLEIPAVNINWRPSASYMNESVAINFYPYPKLLFQGLGVIAKNLQWRSIVIFYENTENLIALQDVLKIQDYDGTKSALKQIQNKTEYRIIVDCKTEHIIDILSQAKELKLLEPHFSYFLTSLDAHTVDLSVLDTTANITTVRIINPESEHFQYVLSRWKQYADGHGITNVDLDQYSIKVVARKLLLELV